MNLKKKIFVVFIFISSLGISQWKTLSWDEFDVITKKIAKTYDLDTYTLKVQYKTFKGKQVITPFETSTGFIQKTGNQTYSYLQGIVTIANPKIKLTIDSNNNLVAVNNGVVNQNQDDLLAQYKQTKSMVETLKSNTQNSVTEIQIKYKKNSPIEKVEIKVNDKNELLDITIFYTKAREYEEENGELKSDFVTLKIDYLTYSKKKLYQELKVNEVVSKQEKGFVLTPSFKKFELVDFRLNKP